MDENESANTLSPYHTKSPFATPRPFYNDTHTTTEAPHHNTDHHNTDHPFGDSSASFCHSFLSIYTDEERHPRLGQKVIQSLKDSCSFPVIIDVLKDVQKFRWDKKHTQYGTSLRRPSLLSGADAFCEVLKDRYESVVERVKRTSHFRWWSDVSDPTLLAAGSSSSATLNSYSLLQFTQTPHTAQDCDVNGGSVCSDCDTAVNKQLLTLKPVECSLGCDGVQIVIGYLFCDQEDEESGTDFNEVTDSGGGTWYLCDLDEKVRIDTSKCAFQAAYFFEGCVVIVKGSISSDTTFVVTEMIHPPRELRDDAIYPVEMLGGEINVAIKESRNEAYKRFCRSVGVDESWIVLSDVNLDNPQILHNLHQVLRWVDRSLAKVEHMDLNNYSNDVSVPVGIVMMGNFTSAWSDFSFTAAPEYLDNFTKLKQTLLAFGRVLDWCYIILLPGPKDPGPNIVPKPPIPPTFTNHLQEAIKLHRPNAKIALTSNPCRMRYRNREMVFARQDLTLDLPGSNATLHIAAESKYAPTEKESALHMSALMAGQGHLRPLSINTVHNAHNKSSWDFDYCLRLNPLPDAVFVADTCRPYSIQAPGTSTIFSNPGLMRCRSFAIYSVAKNEVSLGVV